MATVFRVKLDGAQVVPGVDTPFNGIGIVLFDPKKGTASYSFTVNGMDFGSFIGQPATPGTADDVTGLHIHNADPGANGAIVFDLATDDDFAVSVISSHTWQVTGSWDKSDQGGGIDAYASMLKNSKSGDRLPLYVDIDTVGNPGGEIRGQFETLATEGRDTVKGTKGDDGLPGLGGNDKIEGRKGNDFIIGGLGNDKIEGGPGIDSILFTGKLNARSNVDTLVDFGGKDDIWLDSAFFKKLPSSDYLPEKHFRVGPAAVDANDYIILDGRKLIYDKNGNKAGGDTVFAKLGKGVDVDADDIFVM